MAQGSFAIVVWCIVGIGCLFTMQNNFWASEYQTFFTKLAIVYGMVVAVAESVNHIVKLKEAEECEACQRND